MFNNIGGRLKSFAYVIFWIGLIFCIIYGCVMLSTAAEIEDQYSDIDDMFDLDLGGSASQKIVFKGLAYLFLGPFICWIGASCIYALGELIEDINTTAKTNSLIANSNTKIAQQLQSTSLKLEALLQSGVTPKNQDAPKSKVDICCPNCKQPLSCPPEMIYQTPVLKCPLCNWSFETAPFQQKPLHTSDGMVVCPNCKTKQNGDRKICYKCGSSLFEQAPTQQDDAVPPIIPENT